MMSSGADSTTKYGFLLASSESSGDSKANYIIDLPGGLKPELMPKHVAFIMDGNRRWARDRDLPVNTGHTAGGDTMTQLLLHCKRFGVQVLTLFVFSTENWVRPKGEVDFLMRLFEDVIIADLHFLNRNDIQITVIGNRQKLPESLQFQISTAEEFLKGNKGLRLLVAINYSGRYDITEACKKIATKVSGGDLRMEEINEHLFEQQLETSGLEYPNPDLLIRTSGEQRISNFMLWQMAYTELYFSSKLFPDFGESEFIDALKTFQQRQRRFGGHKYPNKE